MASDNLRQVGKALGKSAKDADRALKKEFPIKPRLERIRDVFDSSVDFEMEFVKEANDSRVLLDLFFQLPPPIRGCKSGCIFTKCEEFAFESGGNHYVTVRHPYEPNTVSIFVNGNIVSESSMEETSPDAGEVFFQGTSGPDTVAVCYLFTECPEPDEEDVECICGITDAFDRTIEGRWGTSDALIPWNNGVVTGTGTFSVDGQSGIMATTSIPTLMQASLTPPPFTVPIDIYFDFHFTNTPSDPTYNSALEIIIGGDNTNARVDLRPTTEPGLVTIQNGDFGADAEHFMSLGGARSIHIRKEVIGFDTIVSAQVWTVGNEEPAGWFVTDTYSFDQDTETDFLLQFTHQVAFTGFTVAIDNLRIYQNGIEVTNCSKIQFDDFNRETDEGWGTSTSGIPWVEDSGSAFTYVDGGKGLLSSSVTNESKIMTWNAEELYESPWLPSLSPPINHSFVMRARFLVDFVAPGPGQGFVRLIFETGDPNQSPLINITNSFGNYGFSGGEPGSIDKLDWEQAYYIAELTFDVDNNNTMTFVVYKEGDTPGEASVIADNQPNTGYFEVMYFNQATSGPFRDIYIDYIEFDYEGKPCYSDFSCTTIEFNDEFDRTVAPDEFGTATDGTVWDADINDESNFGAHISVSPSTGGQLLIPATIDDTVIVSAIASGWLETNNFTDFICTFDFTVVEQDFGSPDGTPFFQLSFTGSDNGSGLNGSTSLSFEMHSTSPDHDHLMTVISRWSGGSSGNILQAQPVIFQTGMKYHIKLAQTSTLLRVKIWPDGETEPNYQYVHTLQHIPTEFTGGGYINARIIGASNSTGLTVNLDNLKFLTGCSG